MNNNLLSKFVDSEQKLIDVIGYFEDFEEANHTSLLCAIGFIFEKDIFYVVVQDDDSFILESSDWCHSELFVPRSLLGKQPWSLVVGNPMLWFWALYNHQGYFDGIQIEFSKDTESESIVLQLVALGSEVKYREVSGKCSTVFI